MTSPATVPGGAPARFAHRMQWGAYAVEGGVRFRLWAPSVEHLELLLDGDAPRPMTALEHGWWELTVAGAAPGRRYRYRLDGGLEVPDPASRFQPDDCHGPSEVIDPAAYAWRHGAWPGRPWHEAVVYELHVGTFTAAGTFEAAAEKLPLLAELGITVVELMPVADFPGAHNWGYDGVLLFAPDASYGRPEALKAFVDNAHALGLMVLLDVVYNHFGPDGNFLSHYAAPFFTERHHTPWGAAVNFDTGPERLAVRDFFIANALYWLEEFRFDGLRLDAVHEIIDDSEDHVLAELARHVRAGPGQSRRVHLVLENDGNEAHRLAAEEGGDGYDAAQWNDDFHHTLHVVLTGERDGYYGDYADAPVARLARCLAEGFDYQGQHSPHRGRPRGEPSGHLPPTAFVDFLQNHDQVGNRAFGERIHELVGNGLGEAGPLRAATELLLLQPAPPLLFMGQEWCASTPFPFFCDFRGELAEAVRAGRAREFERFPAFRDPELRAQIPDPVAAATFRAAKLQWQERLAGAHGDWWRLHRDLLALRRRHVVPLLAGVVASTAEWATIGSRGLQVRWRLAGGATYSMLANLGEEPLQAVTRPPGLVYESPALGAAAADVLPGWTVCCGIAPASAGDEP